MRGHSVLSILAFECKSGIDLTYRRLYRVEWPAVIPVSDTGDADSKEVHVRID